jgi:hypothetical protein
MPHPSANNNRQLTPGYASDVTSVSATTSQVGRSDSPRPSLALARNRSSYNNNPTRLSRPGMRGEPVGAFQAPEDIQSRGTKEQDGRPSVTTTRQSKFKAGQVEGALFHHPSSGSVSSTPQPLSSDTPAAQQSTNSDTDSSIVRNALRDTRIAVDRSEPDRQTGLDRIWEWISSRGRVEHHNDYDLLESGVSVRTDGDVKHKHGSSSRRKKTKRARDTKGRLLDLDVVSRAGVPQKRVWMRVWTGLRTRPYRSLVRSRLVDRPTRECVVFIPNVVSLAVQIIFLVALGVFAYCLTKFLIWYLNPDKAPLPWRQYCASRQPSYYALTPTKSRRSKRSSLLARLSDVTALASPSKQPLMEIDSSHPAWPWDRSSSLPPHSAYDDSVDQLEPVGIFIGIMSMDQSREKRMLIRQTYGSHPNSRVRGTESVSVRFIMGKPKAKFASDVELENDSEFWTTTRMRVCQSVPPLMDVVPL